MKRQKPDLKGARHTSARKPLDIVIKTRKQDILTYLQLQADLAKHCGFAGNIYVIVPNKDIDQFKGIIQKAFILVSSEEVLASVGYSGKFQDTWLTQQIIKILAAYLVAHQHYLILDSNTLIGFNFNEEFFLHGTEYVYVVGEFSDAVWELQSRNLLKLQKPGRIYGFRAVNQIFNKENVKQMINYLVDLYKANIVTVLLNYSDELCTEYWAEYALYGVFVRCLLTEPLHHFTKRHDLISFNFKTDFSRLLLQVEKEQPLMIKLYKRRPTYNLPDAEYAKYVKEIKAVYDRRARMAGIGVPYSPTAT
jgi:hypothetical protein